MPYDVKYNETLQIIEVVHTGILTAENLQKSTDDGMALQIKRGVRKFLIDTSELDSVESLLDLYLLPDRYEAGGLSHKVHIALVMPKTSDARTAALFYDAVCNNRFWEVKLFENRDESVAWLTSAE